MLWDCSNSLKLEPPLPGVPQALGERWPHSVRWNKKEQARKTKPVTSRVFLPANRKFATPVLPETSVGKPASPGRLQGSEPCLSAKQRRPAGSTDLEQHRQAGTGTWPCWTPGSLALPDAVAAVTNLGRRLVVARRVHGGPESLTVCLPASPISSAPYVLSNVFKEHSLNDGAYNSISGVLMTWSWFLWSMMSPGPIDGVIAP